MNTVEYIDETETVWIRLSDMHADLGLIWLNMAYVSFTNVSDNFTQAWENSMYTLLTKNLSEWLHFLKLFPYPARLICGGNCNGL